MEGHLNSCTEYENALAIRNCMEVAQFKGGPVLALSSPAKMSDLSISQDQSSDALTVTSQRYKGKPKKQQSILSHFPAPLTTSQVADLNVLLIEMFVDCAIPFRVVDRPSFKMFMEKIRPKASLQLPSRTKVCQLLCSAASTAQISFGGEIDEELKKGHRAGMVVDTWSNVNKIHIEGVLITLGSSSFMLRSELSGFDHHGIAVASSWEGLIMSTYDKYKFHYFCSDDAGQCGRARRILALRYPFVMFNKCWAHQINLMVKALLTRSEFKETCRQAMETAKVINKSSSKWLPQL